MALNGIRALVFDVFGTVVDWRSGIARQAGPFLARHGAGAADPAAFADAWRRARHIISPCQNSCRRARSWDCRERILDGLATLPKLIPQRVLSRLVLLTTAPCPSLAFP